MRHFLINYQILVNCKLAETGKMGRSTQHPEFVHDQAKSLILGYARAKYPIGRISIVIIGKRECSEEIALAASLGHTEHVKEFMGSEPRIMVPIGR